MEGVSAGVTGATWRGPEGHDISLQVGEYIIVFLTNSEGL